MVRARVLVALTVVVLLMGACGGRSQAEVFTDALGKYEELGELLKRVRSRADAEELQSQISRAVDRIVDLTAELNGLGEPEVEEKMELTMLQLQIGVAVTACEAEVQRVRQIEGVPEVLVCLQRLSKSTR